MLFGSGYGGGPVYDLIEESVSFIIFNTCEEKGYRGLFSVPSREFCCWCFVDLGVGEGGLRRGERLHCQSGGIVGGHELLKEYGSVNGGIG